MANSIRMKKLSGKEEAWDEKNASEDDVYNPVDWY